MVRTNHSLVAAFLLLAAALGSQAPAASDAPAITVADLRNDCVEVASTGSGDQETVDREKSTQATTCLAYVNGYLDALHMFREVSDRTSDRGGGKGSVADRVNPAMCVDARMTVEQALEAFLTWADTHRQSWQELASVGMLAALREAHCP